MPPEQDENGRYLGMDPLPPADNIDPTSSSSKIAPAALLPLSHYIPATGHNLPLPSRATILHESPKELEEERPLPPDWYRRVRFDGTNVLLHRHHDVTTNIDPRVIPDWFVERPQQSGIMYWHNPSARHGFGIVRDQNSLEYELQNDKRDKPKAPWGAQDLPKNGGTEQSTHTHSSIWGSSERRLKSETMERLQAKPKGPAQTPSLNPYSKEGRKALREWEQQQRTVDKGQHGEQSRESATTGLHHPVASVHGTPSVIAPSSSTGTMETARSTLTRSTMNESIHTAEEDVDQPPGQAAAANPPQSHSVNQQTTTSQANMQPQPLSMQTSGPKGKEKAKMK